MDFGDEVQLTNEDFVIGVRPEGIEITKDGNLKGEIYSSMPTGMETTVRVAIGNYLLTGVMFGGIVYNLGEKIKMDFKGNNIILFSARYGNIIGLGHLDVK